DLTVTGVQTCALPIYDIIEFFSFPELEGWEQRVFRLDDDIQQILSGFSNDILMFEAIKRYPGLRLMRQEPQQCMLSFVCSSNTRSEERRVGKECRYRR